MGAFHVCLGLCILDTTMLRFVSRLESTCLLDAMDVKPRSVRDVMWHMRQEMCMTRMSSPIAAPAAPRSVEALPPMAPQLSLLEDPS